MEKRYLTQVIQEDLAEKMVFIGGPRQVGKTTIARSIAGSYSRNCYLNWDNPRHKQQIIEQQWPPDSQCLIFDEIHKYNKWKNLIKGIWDTRTNEEKIIVTGSSRLDIYRRSGDSLLGRYHYHVLHPFSLAEINHKFPEIKMPEKRYDLELPAPGHNLDELLFFGGFPEPWLSGSERSLLRWQTERFERIFREDIRYSENIRSLSQVELLGALLPKRVASPLSLSSLSEDVQTSPKSIISWMELLCRNYYCFRVMPYHHRLERALKKESKYYLWDWSEIDDKGAKFENMIACHLLKFCNFHYFTYGLKIKLWYIRDREGREVDFLITWDDAPWLLVECKMKQGQVKHLDYFAKRLNIVSQKYLVTMADDQYYRDKKTGILVVPAQIFLMALV